MQEQHDTRGKLVFATIFTFICACFYFVVDIFGILDLSIISQLGESITVFALVAAVLILLWEGIMFIKYKRFNKKAITKKAKSQAADELQVKLRYSGDKSVDQVIEEYKREINENRVKKT